MGAQLITTIDEDRGEVIVRDGDIETRHSLATAEGFAAASKAWLRATTPNRAFRDGAMAVAYARKAVAIDREGSYFDTLAAALSEAGNPTEAAAAYADAIAIDGEARLRRYQEDLKKKGFYAGTIDGKTGPGTRAAIEACV